MYIYIYGWIYIYIMYYGLYVFKYHIFSVYTYVHISICVYIYIYLYDIYIYIWSPPKNLCRLQLYWYLQWILYILTPILFRLNLRHQQWENWKTEKLNSIGEVWGPFFSFGIQFFSFSVLGFSWKVKTRKAEKTEIIKWTQAVSIIILLQNAIFHLNL